MENKSKQEHRLSNNDENVDPLLQKQQTGSSTLPSPTVTDDVIDVDYTCGIGAWQPRKLQFFTRFNAAFCVVVFGMVCTTLNFAALSTSVASWERRYGFSSTFIGVTFTVIDVAGILALLFVTYFGGQPNSHRPRWIGVGMLVSAIGIFLLGSVQFMSDPYDIGTAYLSTDNSSLDTIGLCSPDSYHDIVQNTDERGNISSMQGCAEPSPNQATLLIIMMILLGLFLLGAGTAAFFSLAVSYIDDNVPKKKSPMYMGILYCMFGIGPLVGFPVASYCNSIYVDFYRVDMTTIDITQYDPRWIGAWWLPYLMNACILCLAAVPLILLPKKFRVDGNDSPDTIGDKVEKMTVSQKLKAFPAAVKRLFINAPFMFVTMGHCADLAVLASIVPFLTKYMKDQFRTSVAIAAITIPISFILPSAFGTLLGGLLLRKYKPKLPTIAKWVIIVSVLVIVCSIPMMFIGCGNYGFAGVNIPYQIESGGEDSVYNLDGQCNSDCHCSPTTFNPVCGSNGITYLSSCHAGCNDMSTGSGSAAPTNFTDCFCVSIPKRDMIGEIEVSLGSTPSQPDNLIMEGLVDTNASILSPNVTKKRKTNVAIASGDENTDVPYIPMETDGGYAMTGICGTECTQQLYIFMVVFFVLSFIKPMTATCEIELTLRCVDPKDKPFAFGIRSIFGEILAWIPAPIFIGAVFDSTCQLWGEAPCGERGACWVYDLPAYRMKYVAVLIAIKIVAAIFYILHWFSIRNVREDETNGGKYKQVALKPSSGEEGTTTNF